MYGPYCSAYPQCIYEFDQGEIAGWSFSSGFKAGYIEKVMRLDNGFHKTVENVMCLISHTLVPILQIHTHKSICTNS